MQLLEVVRAEMEAERLITAANEQKAAAIKHALLDRERRLKNLVIPQIVVSPPEQESQDLTAIKEHARRNKNNAVKRILEACYAS